jgi:hypothetical protein
MFTMRFWKMIADSTFKQRARLHSTKDDLKKKNLFLKEIPFLSGFCSFIVAIQICWKYISARHIVKNKPVKEICERGFVGGRNVVFVLETLPYRHPKKPKSRAACFCRLLYIGQRMDESIMQMDF